MQYLFDSYACKKSLSYLPIKNTFLIPYNLDVVEKKICVEISQFDTC